MKVDENNPIFSLLNGAISRFQDEKGRDEKSATKAKQGKGSET